MGNGPRPENLGAANLSGSETSILSQAMARAKQLEEEEKAERIGENCYILKREFFRKSLSHIASKFMTSVYSFKMTQMTRTLLQYKFSKH